MGQGVLLLRDAFSIETLAALKQAATRCFDAIGAGDSIPEQYQFSPFSHSVLLAALSDFGCTAEQLLAPLSAPGLDELFSQALGGAWICERKHSWVRRKFAPSQEPSPRYQPHGWHQDGGLGAKFPLEPGPVIPMTKLVTCWIPLSRCGLDSPALEFVRCPQPALLHFTDLDDSALRQRFPPELFWAPPLEFGDGLVFLNSVLHRTYTHAGMSQDRLSVEYRVFPN